MSDNMIIPNIWAVLTLLRADPHLVHFEVEDGIVYLEGLALNPEQKRGIETALQRLRGVRQVINCLALEHVARLPHAAVTPFSFYRPALRSRAGT